MSPARVLTNSVRCLTRRPTRRAGTRPWLAVMLGLLGLAGCAVGPDFTSPAGPATAGYTHERLRSPGSARVDGDAAGGSSSGAQTFRVGRAVPEKWWRTFGSRDLDDLVEQALAANPTIEAARAAIRIARDNALAQQATLYPQIGLNAQALRAKTAQDLSAPLANGSVYTYNLFTPALGLTYTPDLFGGNQRQVESLEAQTENERFQFESAVLQLETSVVAAAIQEASLRGQIDATRKVIALQQELLGSARRQLDLGQSSGADVEQQVAVLAQSQQLLPPLEKQLAQQRNLLTVMAGRFPADEIRARFSFGSLRLPAQLPVTLPGELVRNRPDVRSAEATLHAASAGIGVAIANRFPQLTLSATGGLSAARIASLAAPGAGFYTLAAGLTQPIFDAGQLAYRQQAAQETFDQADAQYRSTVLSAFQNVADALRALQADARLVAASRAGALAAQRSVGLIRTQLSAGGVSNATLLLAQQLYLQALISDVQAQATRFNDTAALFQALGGGWASRPTGDPI